MRARVGHAFFPYSQRVSELLDPLRVVTLERELQRAVRVRRKSALKDRTRLERKVSELHEEKLAKLDGLGHGIDPGVIKEAIERLSEEEGKLREELAHLDASPNEKAQLASISRLKDVGPELTAALLNGPDELRRRILHRVVKRVTYLKEDRNIEIALVLPHPDVPLRLAAPDDLTPAGDADGRVLDRQCPGPDAHRVHTALTDS